MSHANAALTPRARLKVAQLVVDQNVPVREVAARFHRQALGPQSLTFRAVALHQVDPDHLLVGLGTLCRSSLQAALTRGRLSADGRRAIVADCRRTGGAWPRRCTSAGPGGWATCGGTIGVLLFAGPTSTGKTVRAAAACEALTLTTDCAQGDAR